MRRAAKRPRPPNHPRDAQGAGLDAAPGPAALRITGHWQHVKDGHVLRSALQRVYGTLMWLSGSTRRPHLCRGNM
ncbi:unnamed protein product [Boreogadus saida]